MMVLHGLWSAHTGLHVWGERGAAGEVRRGRRRTRSGTGGAARHPFATPADELEEALGGETGASSACVILLPTIREAPLASPGLILGDEQTLEGEPTLVTWSVPALHLDPGEALELLLDLDSVQGGGVRVGTSLDYLAEVSTYALELVSRGRVLPRLTRDGEIFRAIWRPVLTSAVEVERRALLERLMPPACRAIAQEAPASAGSARAGGVAVSAPSAAAVLGDALAMLTDACARRVAGGRSRSRPPGRTGEPESPRDTWLAALTGDTGRVLGDPTALERLRRELDTCTNGGASGSDRPFRTCFRLNPPPDPDPADAGGPAVPVGPGSGWRVDFLLQAADDPSLLVGADRVWESNGRGLAVLDRRIEHPHEWLLADLGRARRLLPELEGPLREPCPASLELDAAGARDGDRPGDARSGFSRGAW